MKFFIVVKKKIGSRADHWENYSSWYGIESTQEKAEDKALLLSPGYKIVAVYNASLFEWIVYSLPFFNRVEGHTVKAKDKIPKPYQHNGLEE
jgi:hypothetical protein